MGQEIHPLFKDIIAAQFPGIYAYECACGCGKKLDPDMAVYYRKGRDRHEHAFINEGHMHDFWELEDEIEAKVALEVMQERGEVYHRDRDDYLTEWFGGDDD